MAQSTAIAERVTVNGQHFAEIEANQVEETSTQTVSAYWDLDVDGSLHMHWSRSHSNPE
jgi:hypothetical protein